MISAFGVEHGDVSKGLPRTLKTLAETPGHGGLTTGSHPGNRVLAHLEGKTAAKYKSNPVGMAQKDVDRHNSGVNFENTIKQSVAAEHIKAGLPTSYRPTPKLNASKRQLRQAGQAGAAASIKSGKKYRADAKSMVKPRSNRRRVLP